MRSIDEQGYHFEEWLTPAQIAKDVKHVADKISADYKDKEPLFVIVLNGAFVFAADLIRALDPSIRCEETFIRVSSYFGMSTTGQLQFIVPLQQVVENRDVVIIEDIVDTGLTIHQLKAHLRGLGAATVKTVTMLFKPEKLEYEDAKPDYVGHEISEEFVIGYGLDFDGFVRNLDAIYKVKE
jgi:hypoxanthine phosphoribosyltransferase